MTTKQWYRAHLRWAVMVEGKEGTGSFPPLENDQNEW